MNEKYSCLCFEDMVADRWYTFTLNPSDGHQYFNTDDRLRNSINKVLAYLKKINVDNIFYMSLYPEVSKSSRIHFHGIIKIYDKITFYIDTLYKLQRYGTYEIDEITDEEVWTDYCSKQSALHKYVRKLQYSLPLKCGSEYAESRGILASLEVPPPEETNEESQDTE